MLFSKKKDGFRMGCLLLVMKWLAKLLFPRMGVTKEEREKRQPRADKRFCYVATSECKPRLPSEL